MERDFRREDYRAARLRFEKAPHKTAESERRFRGAERAYDRARAALDEAVHRQRRIELILEALKSSRGNKAKAAKALGISERLMGLRVNKHGIDPKRFRPGN